MKNKITHIVNINKKGVDILAYASRDVTVKNGVERVCDTYTPLSDKETALVNHAKFAAFRDMRETEEYEAIWRSAKRKRKIEEVIDVLLEASVAGCVVLLLVMALIIGMS